MWSSPIFVHTLPPPPAPDCPQLDKEDIHQAHGLLGIYNVGKRVAGSRKGGHTSKHDGPFMRGNLLKCTAITCSASPRVIKSGRAGALASLALANEAGMLAVGFKDWLGVTLGC